MLRSRFTLGLAAVLACSAPPQTVSITWTGQSFFEIKSSDGTVIAIDPHNLEAFGRREVKADAVLMSHYHIDHLAPEPIVDFRATKKLYGLKNPKGLAGQRREDEF